MFAVIFWLFFWFIGNGLVWSIFSFLFKKWFEISFVEWAGLMFDRLALFSINNVGASLIISGLFSFISVITLIRFGVCDKLIEKIDEIGGFNKFRIMPRFINYTNFELNKPTYFTVVIQVKNIGNNISKLTDWDLMFIDQSGQKFPGHPLYHKGEIKVNSANNSSPPLVFPEEKALYKITINSIEPGDSITGVIQFTLIGLIRPINGECLVRLSARDNKDRKIVCETRLKTINERGPQLIAELHEVSINDT